MVQDSNMIYNKYDIYDESCLMFWEKTKNYFFYKIMYFYT